nr:hypothetical protein [Tanacetum cinerariifolium]
MQSMEKTISEVHSLLIEFEKIITRNKQLIVGASSTPQVMTIQGGRVQKYKPQGKAKGKGKGKGPQNSYPTKPKKPQPYKKERPAKDGQYWAVLFYRHNKVACLMLGAMSPKLYQVQKYKPQGNAKGKGKGMGPQNSYPTKPKKPQPYKKERPTKDGQCHHCKEEGHWKRNYPMYLAELMKKKKKTGGQNVASTSSGAKMLKRGSLYLYVGNGVRAKVEAIGSFDLVLPNGLMIVLDNCHYAPSITRGVVSVSCLVDKGFTQCFTDFELSVSMNNILYFNAIIVNGIYEVDMRDSTLPIVNSMYSISDKRTKSNLDSTYLWHCRLAHINKKRIEKLQHDGLLKSTDNELFDQCVSCISGKMTRKPF